VGIQERAAVGKAVLLVTEIRAGLLCSRQTMRRRLRKMLERMMPPGMLDPQPVLEAIRESIADGYPHTSEEDENV